MEPRPIGLFAPKHTAHQILDFYHATEYLTDVADAQFARDPRARIQWLNDACTRLKHDLAGPQVLIEQMQAFLVENKQPGLQSKIKVALTYFHAPATVNEICPALITKLANVFVSYLGGM